MGWSALAPPYRITLRGWGQAIGEGFCVGAGDAEGFDDDLAGALGRIKAEGEGLGLIGERDLVGVELAVVGGLEGGAAIAEVLGPDALLVPEELTGSLGGGFHAQLDGERAGRKRLVGQPLEMRIAAGTGDKDSGFEASVQSRAASPGAFQ
jgi:hypothetical protein